MSPSWSEAAKRWAVTAIAVLGAIFLYFVRDTLFPLALALILAFLLSPVATFVQRRLHAPRIVATLIVYISLLALFILPLFLVPNLVVSTLSLIPEPSRIQELITTWSDRLTHLEDMGVPLPVAAALRDNLDRLGEVAGSLGSLSLGYLGRATASVASLVIEGIFVLVLSLYIVADTPRIMAYLRSLVPPGYERDADGLAGEIHAVWAGFFRGQLVLSLSIGVVVAMCLWLVGVPYPVGLGILAGVLEIVPNIGPILAAVPAVLLALFQGSTRLDINNLWFAALVIGLYVVIQQVENHVFVPRIIGGSVNLHPAVALVGVFIGASLAGILGVFLAAPTIATLRAILRYVMAKIQGRDPFPDAVEDPPPQPMAMEIP